MLITYKVFLIQFALYIKKCLYLLKNSNSATIKNNTNEKRNRKTKERKQRVKK